MTVVTSRSRLVLPVSSVVRLQASASSAVSFQGPLYTELAGDTLTSYDILTHVSSPDMIRMDRPFASGREGNILKEGLRADDALLEHSAAAQYRRLLHRSSLT